jgi:DHA1 family tetracycline resistance protein-like MFS transporter
VRNRLTQILLFVFIDVLGYSLILPLLSYYADTFGASPAVIGLLIASNALTQLLGAPIIGRLSDRYGRRPMLILSIAGTVVSFLLLATARSLGMLFLSRILDGFLGGNTSLAQAYISDVTEEKDRARGMGMIGASFGLGFIFGPALGGILSFGGNYGRPALAAAVLSALNLIGVLLWLPESLPPEKRAQFARDARSRPSRSRLPALWTAFQRPCVGPLLSIRLAYSLAFTMFETVFSLYAIYRLGLNVQTTSYVLAYVGVLVVIVQGGSIGALVKRFQESHLAMAGIVLMTLSLLGWGLAPNLWVLLVVLLPLALAAGILNTMLNSLLSKVVRPEEVGGTLGLSNALASFARVVSPIVGGFLIDGIGAWAPGVAGAFIMAGLIIYGQRELPRLPIPPTPDCTRTMLPEPEPL